jgi:hypothetical protein
MTRRKEIFKRFCYKFLCGVADTHKPGYSGVDGTVVPFRVAMSATQNPESSRLHGTMVPPLLSCDPAPATYVAVVATATRRVVGRALKVRVGLRTADHPTNRLNFQNIEWEYG